MQDPAISYWLQNKQTFTTMLQNTPIEGVSREQYLASQLRRVVELSYSAGQMNAATKDMRNIGLMLSMMNKELNGGRLSDEERAFAAALSKDYVPSFCTKEAR